MRTGEKKISGHGLNLSVEGTTVPASFPDLIDLKYLFILSLTCIHFKYLHS